MTKELWDARQKQVHEEVDPHTGRVRLVNGNGGIVERIVSRQQQAAINAQATRGDGATYLATVMRKAAGK